MLFSKRGAKKQGPIKRRKPAIRPHGKTLFTVHQRSRTLSSRTVRWLIGIGVVTLVLASYGVLFFAPTFRISKPVFTGLERLNEEDLASVVEEHLDTNSFLIFPQRSLLAAPSAAIKSSLLASSGVIADVEVRKELPNVLKIIITEREPNAIWSSGSSFLYIDDRGIAYEEIARSESRDVGVPVIVDEQRTPVVAGDRVITLEVLDFALGAYDELTRTSVVGINFFIAPSKLAPDLILVTTEGWKVFFDATMLPQIQVLTLTEVLEKEVSDRRNLDYIDLRVAGRVFVK